MNRNHTYKLRYKARDSLKTKSLPGKETKGGNEPLKSSPVTPLCAMNTETWTNSTAGLQELISCVRTACVHVIRNTEYNKWSPNCSSRIHVNKPANENGKRKTISALWCLYIFIIYQQHQITLTVEHILWPLVFFIIYSVYRPTRLILLLLVHQKRFSFYFLISTSYENIEF